jgi:citrate synthase
MGPDAVRSSTARLLSAEAAAKRLGVSKASLYAYVSRGLLSAVPDVRDHRASRYSSFEIELLARRRGRRQQAEQAMAALAEGRPILETALSCIHAGQPIYRGHAVLTLAESASVEDVARLLWQCDPHDPFDAAAPKLGERWADMARSLRHGPIEERAMILLALAQAALHGPAWLSDPKALALAAGQHLRAAMACFLARAPDTRPLHEQFARAWRLKGPQADAVRRALVLAADHELNIIAFTARGLVSVGAPMAAAVLASMCSVQASINGGDTQQVERLWDECLAERDTKRALARRLAAGAGLPGFNHLAYPGGDPRATMLLDAAASFAHLPPIAAEADALTGWKPTIAFGLVALRRAMAAPPGAALALQMAGRCTGVIAHILEQRRSGQRIMPRARYVGPLPQAGASNRRANQREQDAGGTLRTRRAD